MEEDFSIMATGDDAEWLEVSTSAFEPEEITTDIVEIDEVDQLADTFASSKFWYINLFDISTEQFF